MLGYYTYAARSKLGNGIDSDQFYQERVSDAKKNPLHLVEWHNNTRNVFFWVYENEKNHSIAGGQKINYI